MLWRSRPGSLSAVRTCKKPQKQLLLPCQAWQHMLPHLFRPRHLNCPPHTQAEVSSEDERFSVGESMLDQHGPPDGEDAHRSAVYKEQSEGDEEQQQTAEEEEQSDESTTSHGPLPATNQTEGEVRDARAARLQKHFKLRQLLKWLTLHRVEFKRQQAQLAKVVGMGAPQRWRNMPQRWMRMMSRVTQRRGWVRWRAGKRYNRGGGSGGQGATAVRGQAAQLWLLLCGP